MARRYWPMIFLTAAAVPAMAQYAPSGGSDEPQITPKQGQSREKLWADRYDCYTWARAQSGYDPMQHGGANSANDYASGREQYRRALSACLEGKGYSVQYGVAATPAPARPLPAPLPAPPPVSETFLYHSPSQPQFAYHPLQFQIDGGATIATGSTGDTLDDGPNVGLGLTWFPIAALPVGLRVDGSYSWFDARRALLEESGYNHGHENIYGGDADIQLDLAHASSSFKLYLFGGAGWYREQTRLGQDSFGPGGYCGFCGPGVVAGERSTSPWRDSWNAGLGWQASIADNASFFIEARYLRIAPMSSKTQFVPIRVGIRF